MAKKFINKNIFLCHKFLFLCLCWNSNNNNINYNWHIVSTYLQKKKKIVVFLIPKIPISDR